MRVDCTALVESQTTASFVDSCRRLEDAELLAWQGDSAGKIRRN
jgi:hypothetical protein